MVRFTLFGVPVVIHPWFWLTMAFLGGIDASNPQQFMNMALFILAGTISILVHEFGHALTGLRLGGGRASIELWAFGGLAWNQGGRFTRSQRFWMIAAGPGAGFALGLLILLILCVAFGAKDALAFAKLAIFNISSGFSAPTFDFLEGRHSLFMLIIDFLWINFWWGVMNLLPVTPLDGGQISELFVKPKKRVHQIAVVAALAVVIFALTREQIYLALLFGYLAWKNVQSMKELHWQ